MSSLPWRGVRMRSRWLWCHAEVAEVVVDDSLRWKTVVVVVVDVQVQVAHQRASTCHITNTREKLTKTQQALMQMGESTHGVITSMSMRFTIRKSIYYLEMSLYELPRFPDTKYIRCSIFKHPMDQSESHVNSRLCRQRLDELGTHAGDVVDPSTSIPFEHVTQLRIRMFIPTTLEIVLTRLQPVRDSWVIQRALRRGFNVWWRCLRCFFYKLDGSAGRIDSLLVGGVSPWLPRLPLVVKQPGRHGRRDFVGDNIRLSLRLKRVSTM